MYYGSKKVLSSITVYNIDNKNKCFLSSKSTYYFIIINNRMISKGSCDTEDNTNLLAVQI